jgi:hypothetical protein
MTDLPDSLQGYVPGVGRLCSHCGARVVETVVEEEGPYLCPRCAPPQTLTPEESLERLALLDPAADAPLPERGPTGWRLVVLILVAVGALAFVFRK